MSKRLMSVFVLTVLALDAATTAAPRPVAPQADVVERINLAQRLGAGTLRGVNRDAVRSVDRADGVRLSERPGNGLAWIDGTDLATGTIELDVRGRDLPQQSFVGVAFHRRDDATYDAVYLRPFNFRNADVARRENAVQYIWMPTFDWPRLRQEFPSEFENPVDPAIVPTDWVPLRIVVAPTSVRVFVGSNASPALEVRRLGTHGRGQIGLWVGNNSDGEFANLRVARAR